MTHPEMPPLSTPQSLRDLFWSFTLLALQGFGGVGILLPSTTLTFAATRWAHQNRELHAVRAFKQGMAPIVVALLMATSWILAGSHGHWAAHWPLGLVTVLSALLVWRTRVHLLWLLGAGGVLGWLGWI